MEARPDEVSRVESDIGADIAFAAKGGGTLFAGRLFTWGIRFGVAVMLARLLGANGYGIYNLALSVATIGSIFPQLGLDTAIVRYVAIFVRRSDWAAVRAILRLTLSMSLALSLVVMVGLILFAEPVAGALLHDRRQTFLVVISALMVPTMVLNIQLGSALRGLRRIGDEVLADQVVQPLIRLALLLLLILVGLTVSQAVMSWTVSSLLTGVLLAYYVIRAVRRGDDGDRNGESRILRTRELLRFSIPVFLSNVVLKSSSQLQTLLLGALSTVRAVGVFAVATNVNLIGSLFHASLVTASMPLFAAAQDRQDRAALERLYQLMSKWSLTLNLPIFLIVVAHAEALLAMFGSEFRSGTVALMILAAANLVNSGTGMSGALLDMTGYTGLKLLNATISVALGIALNLSLVPSFGLIGAAIAALAVTAGINLLPLAEVLLLVRASPYNRAFMKPIGAGALALAASVGVKILLGGAGELVQAAVGIPLLLVTYGLVLFGLGMDDDDRLVLDRVRARFVRRRRGNRRGRPSEPR